ncbi:MAG: hypothetical protein H7Z40_08490 [Phycisphaerae bacterium]|nr:hypothetical protein [Gemmatimonadaceae bacterium]
MGLKPGMRAHLRNAPESAISAIDPPELIVRDSLRGTFDYLHVFCTTTTELDRIFPKLRDHLDRSGRLFVSWPKSGKLESDLSIKNVIRIGYSHGLVESTALRIDDTWSALKFTWPKAGKVYHNSYGRLPT